MILLARASRLVSWPHRGSEINSRRGNCHDGFFYSVGFLAENGGGAVLPFKRLPFQTTADGPVGVGARRSKAVTRLRKRSTSAREAMSNL